MGMDRFRPRLERVEDRLTPAVSAAEANFAMEFAKAGQEELGIIWQHAGDPKTEFTLGYHRVYLQQVNAVSHAVADTIGAYAAQVSAAAGSDPALAPYLQNLLDGQRIALSNAAYSAAFAIGFGLPASTFTPTPPVSPPPAVPPDTQDPLDPTDDSGISRTIPDLNSSEWTTTPSGLRIWDVIEGEGTPFAAGESVTVHYVGWLTNGSEFDSSLSRNAPSTFSLNEVIEGWKEGIPGLKPGGLRRLDIPAELAYGAQARTGIPANSRLVFEIKGLTPGTT